MKLFRINLFNAGEKDGEKAFILKPAEDKETVRKQMNKVNKLFDAMMEGQDNDGFDPKLESIEEIDDSEMNRMLASARQDDIIFSNN
jgi:hypothetical protein